MDSYSLELKFKETIVPIQIVVLNQSYFIYVGTTHLNFENLTIGMFSNSNKEQKPDFDNQTSDSFCCSSVILDDIYSNHGKELAERLSYKFNCPIYLSFNIPDEYITLELKIKIEASITNYLRDLNDKKIKDSEMETKETDKTTV